MDLFEGQADALDSNSSIVPIDVEGCLSKMQTRHVPCGDSDEYRVEYSLRLSDTDPIDLSSRVGHQISLEWTGKIHCVHCDRVTRKSFGQGYCYPCFSKLAQCDSCMMSPEKCHFHLGTCREPEWAESVCFQPHYVYLANSSGIKVGITRESQMPTRWMDQGAVQAMVLAKVSSRRLSGLVEDLLRQQVPDKTNWRNMLKGLQQPLDLQEQGEKLWSEFESELSKLTIVTDGGEVERLQNAPVWSFDYPVLEHPTKVSSFNFDKKALVEGRLMGIKGQYLILDSGVINLRKFGGYRVRIQTQLAA